MLLTVTYELGHVQSLHMSQIAIALKDETKTKIEKKENENKKKDEKTKDGLRKKQPNGH